MASRIHLECDEPQVRGVLRAWLDRARLDPPIPLWIDVRLEEPPALTDDPRPVFRQPGGVVRAGPPGGGGHLTLENAPAVAEVHATKRMAWVPLSPPAAARLDECAETFLVTVLIFLLRRAGWHHIHAATAVDPAGRGWLL